MSKLAVRKPRDWFVICSWIALAFVFAALVVYMSLHIEDMLDADMSSELVLAQQLKQSGGVLSSNWYYSTEIRVINTQLIYSLFFHLFDDWQTVRILGNVTLYVILLASYYFLCRRLRITRYFPISAAILLLPLSAPYFYIFLYGTYYIPRVSILFIILGLLMQPSYELGQKANANVIFSTLIACALSLALGLEGARMLLVLFVPIAVVVGAEFIARIFRQYRQAHSKRSEAMVSSGFPLYFIQAFLACVCAVTGYLINQKVLIHAYPFEKYETLAPHLTLGGIKSAVFNQIHLIGNGTLTYLLSALIWAAIGALIVWYLQRKGEKSASGLRFVWFCFASWACYTAFCCVINFGQVAWHMVPVAVLWIPAAAVILRERHPLPAFRRALCIGMSVCFLLVGIQGYSAFENWSYRKGNRTNDAYQKIAAALEEQGYKNGYATFWNANILTELSDGAIDVWCVETFNKNTTRTPDIYQWLQVRTHENTLPAGRTFLVWNAEEFAAYSKESFSYLGDVIYQDDAFVVFDVMQ